MLGLRLRWDPIAVKRSTQRELTRVSMRTHVSALNPNELGIGICPCDFKQIR